MKQNTNQKQIYIVISQTGTFLSRILKVITGAEYNHVSISLANDLNTMYSFGRRHAYNPLWAGFVRESPHYGTFKRFPKTKAVVLALPVEEELYLKMQYFLEEMYQEKEKYGYNYLGLILAGIRVNYSPENRYYCSEFVRDTLLRFEIMQSCQVMSIMQPIHFLQLFNSQEVYRGTLQNYSVGS